MVYGISNLIFDNRLVSFIEELGLQFGGSLCSKCPFSLAWPSTVMVYFFMKIEEEDDKLILGVGNCYTKITNDLVLAQTK